MDHGPRPSSPYLPPSDEPAGWVVAGEEQPGWAPSPEDGWYATPPYDPGYGGQRYGDQGYGEPAAPGYPAPEPDYPPNPSYPPAPSYLPPPEPGYQPPEPAAHPPAAYPAAGYPAAGPPTRPRPDARRLGRRRPPPPPDEPTAPGWAPALLWTIGVFLVPALVYLGWALSLSGAAPAGCLDAAGAACPAPRTEAVDRLAGALPALGGALTLALLVAVLVRRIAADWRGMTVGLAAAVIGAGLATLVGAIVA